jgi:hypothetical protein
MLFVTLHGGQPGKHPLRNNVHAYDKDGKLFPLRFSRTGTS